MNIRLAYNAFLEDFKSLFPEVKLYDPNDKEPIDLLIFSGGADVSLHYYLDQRNIERYRNMCMCNEERDIVEKDLFIKATNGQLKVKKILGVCRGIQLINVLLGGTLFPDLGEYDIQHPDSHEIKHLLKSNISFMTLVNSLHHQGLRGIGNYCRETDRGYRYYLIAVDKVNGHVPEIVLWDNNILGVQFHPEFYDDTYPDKKNFVQLVRDWINGTKDILTEDVYKEVLL